MTTYSPPVMTVNNLARQLKTARGHMMPPPLHLFNIRCKCFMYRRTRYYNIKLPHKIAPVNTWTRIRLHFATT